MRTVNRVGASLWSDPYDIITPEIGKYLSGVRGRGGRWRVPWVICQESVPKVMGFGD